MDRERSAVGGKAGSNPLHCWRARACAAGVVALVWSVELRVAKADPGAACFVDGRSSAVPVEVMQSRSPISCAPHST